MLFGLASAQTPAAAFSGTPTTGQAPLTVKFTDQSTGSPHWLGMVFQRRDVHSALDSGERECRGVGKIHAQQRRDAGWQHRPDGWLGQRRQSIGE